MGHSIPANSELPLKSFTPPVWAVEALKDPLDLLNDHAWLEKKAAANALELISRWPPPKPPKNWVNVLAGVARDEAVHLAQVVRILGRRGGHLTRSHSNSYANGLRGLVRQGRGSLEVLDRLLISALIELRSCERFSVLGEAAPKCDPELAKLYRSLWASELGHYHVFLKLADSVVKPAQVAERWEFMLNKEADILAIQPPGPRMHSGMGIELATKVVESNSDSIM